MAKTSTTMTDSTNTIQCTKKELGLSETERTHYTSPLHCCPTVGEGSPGDGRNDLPKEYIYFNNLLVLMHLSNTDLILSVEKCQFKKPHVAARIYILDKS